MNKIKELIEEAILLAVDSIRIDITNTSDCNENYTRSASIKLLAEAYYIVHHGNEGDC